MTKQPTKKKVGKNWLDNLIDFYDFVWKEGVESHGACINEELLQDFQDGGNEFEKMKALILARFPTKKDAEEAFSRNTLSD